MAKILKHPLRAGGFYHELDSTGPRVSNIPFNLALASPFAMHKLLGDILRDSLSDSSSAIDGGGAGPVRSLDFLKLITRFKQRWIYGTSVAHPIDYTRFSGSLFLLLHKNVSVTNISCAELLSLLRTHTFVKTNIETTSAGERANVSFFSDEEYTKFLSALFESLIRPHLNVQGRVDEGRMDHFVDLVCENYGDLLERTAIANFYYTSALLHIPQSLCTDVRSVIAESGYIHSGGNAIYTRRADKANMVELEANLSSFLNGYSDKNVFLTPYAEEFFTPYDANSVVSMRQGLDGVKLILKKHFIEGKPLIEYLATLPSRFPVHVPLGIGDYKSERKKSQKVTETKGSVWFISDHSIAHSGIEQGSAVVGSRVARSRENPFLFVYEQAFINENQFVAFKERKPGWYASITLPHTLSIALTNITRGTADSPARPIILDPFFGTGTTLFDAALRFKNAVVIGFDRDPMAPIAARDNAHFFGLNGGALQRKIELVEAGMSLLKKAGSYDSLRELAEQSIAEQAAPPSHTAVFAHAFTALDNHFIRSNPLSQTSLNLAIKKADFTPAVDHSAFTTNSVDNFDTRFLLYIMWRAISLGTFSIRDSFDNINLVLEKELSKTLKEIEYLRDRVSAKRVKGNNQIFCQSEGLYSHSLSVSTDAMKKLSATIVTLTTAEMRNKGSVASWDPGVYLVHVEDSIETLKSVEGEIDVLMTDPPYGFNEAEGGEPDLMKNFGRLSSLLVRSLRTRGQIAMVLPAFAKNGRQIPFYETGGAITRQLITAAQLAGKHLITQAETVPRPKELFVRPYYWVSTTVLERRILHFSLSN